MARQTRSAGQFVLVAGPSSGLETWPGIGVDGRLGPFSYPGTPLTATYDWVKYTRY